LGLWVELVDGTREWLSEAEVDAICDVLWSSDQKGAVSIVGKIADERRRRRVFQEGVKLRECEGDPFRHALDQARHQPGLYQVSGE
jgi:hypothetical protein